MIFLKDADISMTSTVSGLMGLWWAESATGSNVAQWIWPKKAQWTEVHKTSLDSPLQPHRT
jgi:hypothetical protein